MTNEGEDEFGHKEIEGEVELALGHRDKRG